MAYCTYVQTSFAIISEPKMFSLALNKWESATSVYHQFPKYQSSHLQESVFEMLFLVLFS